MVDCDSLSRCQSIFYRNRGRRIRSRLMTLHSRCRGGVIGGVHYRQTSDSAHEESRVSALLHPTIGSDQNDNNERVDSLQCP